ncbi:hypothetical protein BH10CYA1_BH10CYA1_08180 [soil metagenome]
MQLNRTILAALSVLAIAVSSAAPAEALVGRLSSHSIGAVRRVQQAATKAAHSHARGLRTASRSRSARGLKVAMLKHKHGKGKVKGTRLAHGSMNPSYLWNAPNEVDTVLEDEMKAMIVRQFHNGNSQEYSTSSLIQSGVFASCPLHGGVFKRHTAVKNIILHSTETAREADAQRVILSWNNKGLRHAGAQFVVDRDGVIYCTADPEYGTTHVDNRRTRHSVNNDNSVGIEIVRTGTQEYTAAQMNSVVCLVRYLQNRFEVTDNHVFGHGQVQPSDRSDPVNFDWQSFTADKQVLTGTAYANRVVQ